MKNGRLVDDISADWFLDACYTHDPIGLDVHELVVGRGLQYDDRLDVLRRVVEHYYSQPDLLALFTLVGSFHFDEEW